MAVKVLIVDDSAFFRKRITELLDIDPRITVVGTAVDGRDAIEKVKQLRPDVVTMDVEMPQMNGIEALRVIMKECPTHVMMLSSLTREGATTTLKALEAGAADYQPKDIREWVAGASPSKELFRDKVVALGRHRLRVGRVRRVASIAMKREAQVSPSATAPQAQVSRPPRSVMPALPKSGYSGRRFPECRIVVIGSSTGGPAALQKILIQLPEHYPYPILLIQHMPKAFTAVFAERLNQQCKINIKEAVDGDLLKPGHALLAPGGQQLIVDPRNPERVKILPGDERMTYKPSVDIAYASVARSFGSDVLAIILTGMGADGTEGARLLRRNNATIWAQDEQSSTIFGMPGSIIKENLADEILALDEIGTLLCKGKGA
ncbi:MAG: protein-glutamate methylesterase/protein-glutamine glutaminase [Pontibacterium sp.]